MRLQDVLMEGSEVAAALALREPVCVSVRTGDTADVYPQLVQAAMAPERYIPLTPTLEVLLAVTPKPPPRVHSRRAA